MDVGRCIYCREPTSKKLGREHVVPLSLGGGIILQRASCDFHSTMTRHFEEEIAGQLLKPFRTIKGLPTRRKKELPTQFPALLERGNISQQIMVPVANFPDFLPTVAFKELAGLLTDAEPSVPLMEVRIYHSKEVNERRVHELPSGVINVSGKVPCHSFVRLTAKIAHGFAVAHNGLDFEPFLLDTIEGRIEHSGHFIGKAYREFPHTMNAHTHVLAHEHIPDGDVTYIAVSIGLFAGVGAPIHSVIVGCFDTDNPPSPPWGAKQK